MPEFVLNQEDVGDLQDWANRIANPDIAFNANRSAMAAATNILAKETRRAIFAHGVRTGILGANIVRVTNSSRRRQTVNSRVGARNRTFNTTAGRANPAFYFHLFDQGTRGHFQPNAYRPITDSGVTRLVKIEGGAFHPGSEPHPVRRPAQRRAAPQINQRFATQFRRVVFRELEKATRLAQS